MTLLTKFPYSHGKTSLHYPNEQWQWCSNNLSDELWTITTDFSPTPANGPEIAFEFQFHFARKQDHLLFALTWNDH